MSNFLVNIYVKMDCLLQQCPRQTRVGNFSILHFALLDFCGVTWFPFIQISHILHKSERVWERGREREKECTEGYLATSQTATMKLFATSQLFSQKISIADI